MDKVKILVACHKPAEVYRDNVYTPIHVGRAVSKCTDKMQDMIGDDTGDNISQLNPYYCELTAQYWGWKNLDCEYIGLQHYRRYFDFQFTESNIDKVFSNCDVVLANPLYLCESIFDFWKSALVPEDVMLAMALLKRMHPEETDSIDRFFSGFKFYACNMFVCRKELFDEFAQWQFDYLQLLSKVIKVSDYMREKRILGFIAEGLLPYYFFSRNYRIKTMPIVSMIGNNDYLLTSGMKVKLKAFYKSIRSKHQLILDPDDAMVLALKNEGLIDKIDEIIHEYKSK